MVDGLDVIAGKVVEHAIQRLVVMIQACDVQQLELELSRRSGIHDPMTIRYAFGPAIEEEHTERGNVLHIF